MRWLSKSRFSLSQRYVAFLGCFVGNQSPGAWKFLWKDQVWTNLALDVPKTFPNCQETQINYCLCHCICAEFLRVQVSYTMLEPLWLVRFCVLLACEITLCLPWGRSSGSLKLSNWLVTVCNYHRQDPVSTKLCISRVFGRAQKRAKGWRLSSLFVLDWVWTAAT